MTWGGRLVTLFPVLHLGVLLGFAAWSWPQPKAHHLLILLALIYLFPLIIFRLHNLFWPLREGVWDLAEKKYSPWWASHMFQLLFIAVPSFEAVLRLVPGLYSVWLRAWGSRIGDQVYWTPRVEILDRSLVEIGSGCLFGHLTTMSSHAVSEIEGKPMLMVRKIRLGDRVFVGADTQMGPGVTIEAGVKIKPKSRLYWKGSYG